jgi:hypothetical protein
MDSATVTNSSNICLVSGSSASSCSSKVSGTTLSYNPANNTVTLQAPSVIDGTYTVYVSNNVKNIAAPTELAMVSPVKWTFTVDTTAPTVITPISPANNATKVGTNVPIVIKFTEAGSGMNVDTLKNISVTDQNGNNIPCSLSTSINGSTTTATLAPAGGLNFSSTYTISISSNPDATSGNVTDMAGNPVANFTSSFSTAAVTDNTYSAYPSFLCSTIQPNVLVILDNSNSFDFDLNGNAVGSPHCATTATCSKSVLAREALVNMINTYGNRMRIGLMSYQLPTDINSYNLYQNHFFASFDPSTFCANPPQSCQNYCNKEEPKTGTYTMSQDESDCYTKCHNQNTAFVTNTSRPAITTAAGVNNGANGGTAANTSYPSNSSSLRTNYCSLTYPRTLQTTDSNGKTYYYAQPGSMYSLSTNSIIPPFYYYGPTNVYSTELYNASTQQWPQNINNYEWYYQCTGHTGTADQTSFTGCSNPTWFKLSDNTMGLGFYNVGPQQAGFYSSQSFLSLDSPGGGFLNVPADNNDVNNVHMQNLLSVLGSTPSAPMDYENEADYMACSNLSSPNVSYLTAGSTTPTAAGCGHIINAGMTPTQGALQTAMNYYNGTLTQGSTALATPINYSCQKNFVVLVTDGSPDTLTNGSQTDYTTAMNGVLPVIDGFICPASNPTAANCKVKLNGIGVNVPVYVLGMGKQTSDQANYNQMAIHGTTAVNNKAYLGDNAGDFMNALYTIFNNIYAAVGSGTAASILNNSQGSGSSLLQAIFYPSILKNNTQASWIGEMQNLWYYIDPSLSNISIREDTVHDYQLNLQQDNIVQFNFNTNSGTTTVNVFADSNGDGVADSTTPNPAGESPDAVNSLWRAGLLLWQRNLINDPRTIYTGFNSTAGSTPQKFSSAAGDGFVNSTVAQALMQADTQAKAATLINWTLGTDQPDDSDGTEYRARTITWNSSCGLTDSEGCNREWKLGDIVSSTPKLVSNLPLGFYNSAYKDVTYSAFLASNTYQQRGMVLVGANDGMLHAFKLGTLQEMDGKYTKAQFQDAYGNLATAATNLGREEWAFIPTGALPYLTYDSQTDYDHIFSVDRTPTLADASIGVPSGCTAGNFPNDYSSCTRSYDGSTWRTIVIGGMGLGGASRTSDQSCNTVNGSTNTCIISPLSNGGLSSYFALDVTNPENPKYMWEFSGSTDGSGNLLGDLGAATTGPVIIREAWRDANGIPDQSRNGKWYAVFASGPTGNIDTTNHRFMGISDQNLKIFIVDLATGTLVKTFNSGDLTTPINKAFAGSLTTNSIDTDRWASNSNGYYSDDAVYIGYTQFDAGTGKWDKGGVLRLTTNDWNDPTSTTPGQNWTLSPLISGTGPVTTAITKLQDTTNNNLWIYFGTGRFYYNGDDTSTSTQAIYGVREPCYSTFNTTLATQRAGGTVNHIDATCTAAVDQTKLVDQTGTSSSAPSATLSGTASGWLVNLDPSDSNDLTERIISDPTASTAGAVFFTSFKPISSVCAYGGLSYVWALGYNTGGLPPAAAMTGQALLQVSTGQLQQISLSTAFTDPNGNMRYNGRRLAAPVNGMPPTSQGLALVGNPKPVKKIIHIREK